MSRPDPRLPFPRYEPGTSVTTIQEGRYHQVKPMFHAVGNQVLSLHRESIGSLVLDDLPPGKFRPLTMEEISSFTPSSGGPIARDFTRSGNCLRSGHAIYQNP